MLPIASCVRHLSLRTADEGRQSATAAMDSRQARSHLFVLFLFSGEARDLLSQSGLRWAYLLLLSFGVGFVVTPVICILAPRLGAIDVPAGRKAHGTPTACSAAAPSTSRSP